MNLDALFASIDARPVEAIDDIPGLAGTIHMRPLSVAERDAIHRATLGEKYDKKGVPASVINAHSVVAILCEPDGSRLSKADADKLIARILDGSAGFFDALLTRANKVSATAGNAVEDAEKNSGTTENGGSATS